MFSRGAPSPKFGQEQLAALDGGPRFLLSSPSTKDASSELASPSLRKSLRPGSRLVLRTRSLTLNKGVLRLARHLVIELVHPTPYRQLQSSQRSQAIAYLRQKKLEASPRFRLVAVSPPILNSSAAFISVEGKAFWHRVAKHLSLSVFENSVMERPVVYESIDAVRSNLCKIHPHVIHRLLNGRHGLRSFLLHRGQVLLLPFAGRGAGGSTSTTSSGVLPGVSRYSTQLPHPSGRQRVGRRRACTPGVS